MPCDGWLPDRLKRMCLARIGACPEKPLDLDCPPSTIPVITTTNRGHTMNNIRRSLTHSLDYSCILEAGVRMLEEGRYYYTLTVDPGYSSTNGEVGVATTNLEMTTSRIFDTYEDAVLALNISIGQTVVEGGLLPA